MQHESLMNPLYKTIKNMLLTLTEANTGQISWW